MGGHAMPRHHGARAVRCSATGVWCRILAGWVLLQGCASVPKAPPLSKPSDRLLRRIEAPGPAAAQTEIDELTARTQRLDNQNQDEDLLRLAFLYLRQRQPEPALTACYRVKYGGDRLPADLEDATHLLIARAHLMANDPERAGHFARLAETQSKDPEVVAAAREITRKLEREASEPRPARAATEAAKPRTPAPIPVVALGRDRWGAAPPRARLMEPMGTVKRITVHHSDTQDTSADEASSSRVLRSIQQNHMQQKDWGDIAYHYLIDSAGRVWNGRSLTLQGAHAGDHFTNRGNIGICLLGDFESASPTKAQWTSLDKLVRHLLQRHGLPAASLLTHQEIRPTAKGATACPGRRLQAMVERLRADLRG
jgi:hypothetical protein